MLTKSYAVLVMGIALVASAAAPAAEIKVLSIPFKEPLQNIGPKFERTTGHRLLVQYAPSAPLRELITAGASFDVVLTFPKVVDELIQEGKVVPGSRVDISRAG